MNLSGNTPLYRAKNLENKLGVKEIYLKLEGVNPTGHKHDRIAEAIIRETKRLGKKGVVVDGSKQYINSINYFAKLNNIKMIVPSFIKDESFKRKYFNDVLLKVKENKLESRTRWIEEFCEKENYMNAFNGYANNNLSNIALEKIGDEIINKIKDKCNIYSQLSYGYTITSLYNSYYRKYIKKEIESMPKMFSCTIPHGNVIYDKYRAIYRIDENDDNNEINKIFAKDLIVDTSELLNEALTAINDTQGDIIQINSDLLKEASNLLRKEEDIHISTSEAYPIAGLIKNIQQNKVNNGKHIVVLNDAKSVHKLKRIEKDSNVEDILLIVQRYLQQYSDPEIEAKDAVKNALEKGAIFLSYLNNEVAGIAVVVYSEFEEFIPKYHLAYIGTESGKKGRGIASELLNEAIEFSEGSISLHVDLDNNRAKKLYEKFGFKHKYNRMIYTNKK